MPDGALRVRVHAVPANGEANAELVRFLAVYYDAPVSSIKIVSGHTGTRKVVEIFQK